MRSVLAAALAMLAVAGCTSTIAEEDYPFLSNAVGTVVRAGVDGPTEVYVIRIERPRETTVVPGSTLPTAFRQHGLRVEFSGELLPIPPNVRMIGSPIWVSRIKWAR